MNDAVDLSDEIKARAAPPAAAKLAHLPGADLANELPPPRHRHHARPLVP